MPLGIAHWLADSSDAVRETTVGGVLREAAAAHCREHLAPHKTPVRWEVVDAFPLTPSGKIQKFQLRTILVGS